MEIQPSATTYHYIPFHHESFEMSQADHEQGDLCSPLCWTSGLMLHRLEDTIGTYRRVGLVMQYGALDAGNQHALSFWDRYHLLDCV